jgi:uncharacterized repeat protein (TIGR03803 family)
LASADESRGWQDSHAAAAATTTTKVAAPVLNPKPQDYVNYLWIDFLEGTKGASIYYTLDGTVPTSASTKFTGEFKIAQTTTVNAIAIASGGAASTVTSGTYTLTSGPVTESVVYSLGATTADGTYPSQLILGRDGNIYVVSGNGGYGDGAILKITPAGAETVLYAFEGCSQSCTPTSNRDGSLPSSLIEGRDGNFYGTTYSGGTGLCYVQGTSYGCGTIFKLTPAGVETVLYNFNGPAGDSVDGVGPNILIQGRDGNFYGTTVYGGSNGYCDSGAGCGTVFKLTPSGTETVLHSFTYGIGDSIDGAVPGAIFQAGDGNLYGTTGGGGINGSGTVFKISTGGVESVVYSFPLHDIPGATVFPTLAFAGADGDLYGTTMIGGTTDMGSVFKVTTDGAFTELYAFRHGVNGNTSDGSGPVRVLQGSDGNLYGVTNGGGAYAGNPGIYLDSWSGGTVFRITPAGIETVVHAFSGARPGHPSTDGAHPVALLQAPDGNFYGLTSFGGANLAACCDGGDDGGGTVFLLSHPTWSPGRASPP